MEDGRTGNAGKLREFSAEPPRYLTPFFAGRRETLDFIEDRRDLVMKRHENGADGPARGMTVLTHGAPGAGKTSLLMKLKERLKIPCVELEVKDLADPDALLKKTERALSTAGLSDTRRLLMDAIGTISVSAMGAEASLAPVKILEALGVVTGGNAVAVFIDEIQNVDPKNARATECLQTLHEGRHGFPILPVLAGLCDSPDILAKAGISRIEPPDGISVGLLTPEEARESVRSFMEYFEVRGDVGPWIESVARRSDLWPQHLHNGLRALAEELSRTGADIDLIDGKRVERNRKTLRDSAYDGRLSSDIRRAKKLVSSLMSEMRKRDFGHAEVKDHI